MGGERYVIIGARGQLGLALRQQYPRAQAVDVDELDIGNRAAVQAYDWRGTAVILNAAAYTNVDGAETPDGRTLAWKVNATGPRNLAEIARQRNMTLVHISSDYVFDGTHNNHLEDEPFSPINVYGQSKAAGDIAVSLAPQHYLLRATWVVGEGKNFVRTMLSVGQRRVAPTVVDDQIGRLTFTSELVRAADHLLHRKSAYGTYNATNSGPAVSWAVITREIFRVAHYRLKVTGVTTADYFTSKPDAAARPLQSTLDLTKLQQTGFVSHDWRDDLKSYVTGELLR